jgi:hypothetical protein
MLFPALFTIIAFVLAWFPLRNEKPSRGDYSGLGNAVTGLAQIALYMAAAAFSLLCWFLWAVLS